MNKFFATEFAEEEADVITFGVPMGKHAKPFLESFREESQFVEPFYLPRRINWTKKIKVADSGDLKLKSLEEITVKTKDILKSKKIPFMICGGHLGTCFSVKAFDEDVKIIVFDAHSDARDDYTDEYMVEMAYVDGLAYDPKLNPVTWMRRSSEERNPENYFLIGVRSGDESELNYIEKNNVHFFDATQVKKNFGKLKQELKKFVGNSKVYISVDMDCFDPSVAPAVYHPEPNGLTFLEFLDLMEIIGNGKIAGFDIVEVKPIEGNKVTEFLAVQVAFEILSRIK
jgi:arginase family enzyme